MVQLISKAITNFKLDYSFLVSKNIPLSEKYAYVFRKYTAIFSGSKKIEFLGRPFEYDNVFTPALLQSYPNEISRLDTYVNMKQITTILDVGANIGQYGYTIKHFFPHIEIHSFEPNADIMKYLRKNAENRDGWHLYEYAIGETNENKEFYYVPGKSMQGSFYEDNAQINLASHDTKVSSLTVPTIVLDTQNIEKLSLPKHYDLVKIDVEGFEMEVIKGLKDVTFDYMYIELSMGREGEMSKEMFLEEINDRFGSCEVLYYEPSKSGLTADVIISIHNHE